MGTYRGEASKQHFCPILWYYHRKASRLATLRKFLSELIQLGPMSRGVPASMNEDESNVQRLLFAVTSEPEPLDNSSRPISDEHLRQPSFYTICLLLVSDNHNGSGTIQRIILLDDPRAARKGLKSHLSLDRALINAQCDRPTAFVRSVRQFVIVELCKTLDSIKFKLEEVVSLQYLQSYAIMVLMPATAIRRAEGSFL